MSWTEIEIDETGRVTVRRGGALTGGPELETKAKRQDAMACTDIKSSEVLADMDGGQDTSTGGTQAGETEVEPGPEPKPKMVTWRKCVRIQPREIDDGTFYAEWYRSGDIPEDWYPVEAHEQPIQTVKRLPAGGNAMTAWPPIDNRTTLRQQ